MVVWADSCLNSYYVDATSSITFTATDNSCIFFYSGKRWFNHRTFSHWHRDLENKVLSPIRFNGYFVIRTSAEMEFLKKYFTLTDGDSEDFRVTNDGGNLEFYQGDRHVNYSF